MAVLSQIENISVITMKGQNKTMRKWREPPAIKFIIPVMVTAERRDICEKFGYRAVTETRFKTHHKR